MDNLQASIKVRDLGAGVNHFLPPHMIGQNQASILLNMIPSGFAIERRRGTQKTISFNGVPVVFPVSAVYWKGKWYFGSIDPNDPGWVSSQADRGAGLYVAQRPSTGAWDFSMLESADLKAVFRRDRAAGGEHEDLRYLQEEPTDWDLSVIDGKLYATNGTRVPILFDGSEVRRWGLPSPVVRPGVVSSPAFLQHASKAEAESASFDNLAYAWNGARQEFIPYTSNPYEITDECFVWSRMVAGGKTGRYRYKGRTKTISGDGPLSGWSDWISPKGDWVDVYDTPPRTGGVPLRAWKTGKLITSAYHMNDGPDPADEGLFRFSDVYVYHYQAHREVRGVKFLGRYELSGEPEGNFKVFQNEIDNFSVGMKINFWKPSLRDNGKVVNIREISEPHTVTAVDRENGVVSISDPISAALDYEMVLNLTLESSKTCYWRNGLVNIYYGTGDPIENPQDTVKGGMQMMIGTKSGVRYVTVTRAESYAGDFMANYTAFHFYPKLDIEDEAVDTLVIVSQTLITEYLPLVTEEESQFQYGMASEYDCFYIEQGKTKMLNSQTKILKHESVDTPYPSMFLCPFSKVPNALIYASVDGDILDAVNQGNIFLYRHYGELDTYVTNKEWIPHFSGGDLIRGSEENTDLHLVVKHARISRYSGAYKEPPPVIQDRTGSSWSLGTVVDDIVEPKPFKYHAIDGTKTGWFWGLDQEPNFLYRSKPGNPESFGVSDYNEFADPVVSVLPVPESAASLNYTFSVIVFTTREIYGISTSGTEAFRPWRISSEHGCVGRRAAMVHNKIVYFISEDGVYTLSGIKPNKISDNIDSIFNGDKAIPKRSLASAVISYFKPDNMVFIHLSHVYDYTQNDSAYSHNQYSPDIVMALSLTNGSWNPIKWWFNNEDETEVVKGAFSRIVEGGGETWGIWNAPYSESLPVPRNNGGLYHLAYQYLDDIPLKTEYITFYRSAREEFLEDVTDYFETLDPSHIPPDWFDDFVEQWTPDHNPYYTYDQDTGLFSVAVLPSGNPSAEELAEFAEHLYYLSPEEIRMAAEDGLYYQSIYAGPEFDLQEPHLQKRFIRLMTLTDPNPDGMYIFVQVSNENPYSPSIKKKLLAPNNDLPSIQNDETDSTLSRFDFDGEPFGGRRRLSRQETPLGRQMGGDAAYAIRIGFFGAEGTRKVLVQTAKDVWEYVDRPAGKPLKIHEYEIEYDAPVPTRTPR